MSKVLLTVFATALWLEAVQCCMVGYPLPKEGDGLNGKTDYVAQLGEFIEIEENLELTKVMSKYINYGCFCGLGGAGNTPVDETDKCCQIHDHCFDEIEDKEKQASSKFFSFLTLPIADDIRNLELIGLTYHYFYDKQNGISCSEDQSTKQLEKCKCDKALADCLKTNVNSYNEKHLKMVKNETTCPTV